MGTLLDLHNAFKCLACLWLICVLRRMALMELIKVVCRDMVTILEVAGISTETLPVDCGMRHGCRLSQTLRFRLGSLAPAVLRRREALFGSMGDLAGLSGTDAAFRWRFSRWGHGLGIAAQGLQERTRVA